jgi:hypothetical protein
MALRGAILLLAGMSWISWGCVYDFKDYQALPSAAGSGGGGSGGGVAGSGGAGGSGGGVTCDGVDFTQDPQHCGGCGIDCTGGAPCNDGVCGPVATDLAVPARQVATLGERVFVMRGTAPPGEIVTYAAEFQPLDSPLSVEPVCDVTGFLSTGINAVYYRAQNPNTVCSATHEYVYTCGLTPPCTLTMHDLSAHMNGIAVTNTTFYFLTPDGVVHATGVSPEGVPNTQENSPTPVSASAILGEGGFMLGYDAVRSALWWTTYHGCVYKAAFADFPVATAQCFPQTVPKAGLLLVAPNNKIYVGSTDKGIYEIDPNAMVAGPAPAFGPSPDLHLLAADIDYVYAYDTASPSLVAIRHSGVERARFPVPSPIFGADANHPKYLYFVEGNLLYRWRKPVP